MAHIAQDPAPDALRLDLSSTRARVDTGLLDGGGQGQTLRTLLGYRLGRCVHGATCDRLIAPLRELAPLVAGKIARPLEPADPATESIAAENVVDAVHLLQKPDDDILHDLAQRLDDSRRAAVSNNEHDSLTAAIKV